MTKTIHQLIPDIYSLVGKNDVFNTEALAGLSSEVARRIGAQFSDPGGKATLRLSKMGPRCPRALWYAINRPEMAEQLPPWATIKYTYGHILEALVIALAKAAGHTVTGEQDELVVDGIVGHRDCVIDGYVVDVKSASSRSFSKFKNKQLATDDPFGYLDQLDGYLVGSSGDPLVYSGTDVGYLLAIDKSLGHMVLYEHDRREQSIRDRIRESKEICGRDIPLPCTCQTIAYGASGNRILDVKASYSLQKYCCFPNLRIFLYADGPKYFTHVERKPDVMEVDRNGKVVYS